jgi:hypothetical protein
MKMRALFLGGPLHGQVRVVPFDGRDVVADVPGCDRLFPHRVSYREMRFKDLDGQTFLVYQCTDDPRPLRSLLVGGLTDDDTLS